MKQRRRATSMEVALLALYRLGGQAKPVHTEDVALECFRLAPRQFSWRRYPGYPDCDIARVYLSEARKTKRGVLVSLSGPSEREGLWMLTTAGLEWIRSRADEMGAALTAGEQEPPSRQYAQRAINEVVAHRAFTRYHRDGSPAAIPEADFVDSLRCTLNSSAKVLRARLERLRTQATACHNARVLQYLEACERHFRHLLGPAGTPG